MMLHPTGGSLGIEKLQNTLSIAGPGHPSDWEETEKTVTSLFR